MGAVPVAAAVERSVRGRQRDRCVEAHRNEGEPARAGSVVGYLIVQADDVEGARSFLDGNPVLDSGGTVEICELVES